VAENPKGQWCFTVGELLQFLDGVDRSKKICTPDEEDIYVVPIDDMVILSDVHEDELDLADEPDADDGRHG